MHIQSFLFQQLYPKSYVNSKALKLGKSFWNVIKHFFTNREIIISDNITLEENGVLKNVPKETTEVSNNSNKYKYKFKYKYKYK